MNYYAGSWEISAEELSKIIRGEVFFKKCPDCLGRGYEYYDRELGEVYPDQSNEEYLQSLEWSDTDQCSLCQGLGYVKAYEN